jgi:hypothetical protein
MYFDRFDIVTAHYCYCVAYHSGKSSLEYRRLGRITQYFRPPFSFGDVPDTTNGRLIMSAIIRRHFVNRKPYAVNL